MALQLKQQVRLSQQLVMTPQLQQAIKLLQLNRLELLGLVQQELLENPALEESDVDEAPTSAEMADVTPTQASEGETAASAEEPAADAAPSDAEKIADVEWDNYMDAYPQTGLEHSGNDGGDRPGIEATLTRLPNLAEHLTWQLRLSDVTPEELDVASWIIGNLDDEGYLRAEIEELERISGASRELVEATLA